MEKRNQSQKTQMEFTLFHFLSYIGLLLIKKNNLFFCFYLYWLFLGLLNDYGMIIPTKTNEKAYVYLWFLKYEDAYKLLNYSHSMALYTNTEFQKW